MRTKASAEASAMRTALVTGFAVAAPRAALACPVCFGQNDSPMATAMNLGIWVMLAVVVGVLAAFASFFIYLMRRAKMAQQDPAETGHHSLGPQHDSRVRVPRAAAARGSPVGEPVRGREGTAQC